LPQDELVFGVGLASTSIVVLLYWSLGFKKRALRIFLSELIGFLASFSLLVIFYPELSKVGNSLYWAVSETLTQLISRMKEYHSRIVSLSLSIAVFDIIIGIVFAGAGGPATAELLSLYQPWMHVSLSFLETLGNLIGTTAFISHLLLRLTTLLPFIYSLLLTLIPLIFIPRLRRLILPVWLLFLAVSVILPLQVRNFPEIRLSEVPGINPPSGLGYLHVQVREASGTPIYRPLILLGLRDHEGNLYVSRVREGSILILPAGKYKALWVTEYWTNFTLNSCCYLEEKDRAWSYCSCYVWPAVFNVSSGLTVNLTVSLPVDIIETPQGHTGHVIAFTGDKPIHPSVRGEGYVSYYLGESSLKKGVFISFRGGGFTIERFESEGLSCPINISTSRALPPGQRIDALWYQRALQRSAEWLKRVRVFPEMDVFLESNVTNFPIPRFEEQTVYLSLDKCNETKIFQPILNITIIGRGVWNESFIPIYVSHWEIISQVSEHLISAPINFLSSFIVLYNALFVILIETTSIVGLGGSLEVALSTFFRQTISKTKIANLSRTINVFFSTRSKPGDRDKILVKIITPSGVRITSIPNKSRLISALEKVNEAPVPLFLKVVNERKRNRFLHNFYLLSKKKFRISARRFDIAISHGAQRILSPLKRILVSSLGYHAFSRGQLYFKLNDITLRKLNPKLAELMTIKYRELVTVDIRKIRSELTKELSDLVENSTSIESIDRILLFIWLANPRVFKELLRLNKLYAEKGYEVESLQLLYRLKALDQLKNENGSIVKMAKKMYLGKDPGLTFGAAKNDRWRIIWEKLRSDISG